MTRVLPDTHRPGALVISLDLELGWGNVERLEKDPEYARAALGAREVVPALLELFEEFEIAATWAVVGYVFGDDRGEWRGEEPRIEVEVPAAASPMEPPPGGWNELDNPTRVGPSLLRGILAAGRHEIATHTFSHLHCLEPGNTAETLRDELRAARAVTDRWRIPLRSVVFPRNQHAPYLDEVLQEQAITAYRGNPESWMWRFEDDRSGRSLPRRAARLLDAYLPFSPRTIRWENVPAAADLADVKASFFLRPVPAGWRMLEPLRSYRLRRAMRVAARHHELLHLWWHPHNFVPRLEENLGFLRGILKEFRSCRTRWGMRSLTMGQVGEIALGRTQAAAAQVAPARRVR